MISLFSTASTPILRFAFIDSFCSKHYSLWSNLASYTRLNSTCDTSACRFHVSYPFNTDRLEIKMKCPYRFIQQFWSCFMSTGGRSDFKKRSAGMRKRSKTLRHVQPFYVKSRGIGQFEHWDSVQKKIANHYKEKPLFGLLSLLRNDIGMVTSPNTRQELRKGRRVLCVLPVLMQSS